MNLELYNAIIIISVCILVATITSYSYRLMREHYSDLIGHLNRELKHQTETIDKQNEIIMQRTLSVHFLEKEIEKWKEGS